MQQNKSVIQILYSNSNSISPRKCTPFTITKKSCHSSQFSVISQSSTITMKLTAQLIFYLFYNVYTLFVIS